MILSFDRDKFASNVETLLRRTPSIKTYFYFKELFALKQVLDCVPRDNVLCSFKTDAYATIKDPQYTMVDILDRRDGVPYYAIPKPTPVAVVNMYCAQETIPTQQEIDDACKYLKRVGFAKVNIGGSLILGYKATHFDEIRIFDSAFTGFSSITRKRYSELEMPFCLEVMATRLPNGCVSIPMGFAEISGFYGVTPVCISTEFTVLPKSVGTGLIKLYPDYYTLVKLFRLGYMND